MNRKSFLAVVGGVFASLIAKLPLAAKAQSGELGVDPKDVFSRLISKSGLSQPESGYDWIITTSSIREDSGDYFSVKGYKKGRLVFDVTKRLSDWTTDEGRAQNAWDMASTEKACKDWIEFASEHS